MGRIPYEAKQFLSTPSARRATTADAGICDDLADFYPRPPRGGRPKTTLDRGHRLRFLSTPSARRATWHNRQAGTLRRFLSTPSARRATLSIPELRIIKPFLSTPSARRATRSAGAAWAM